MPRATDARAAEGRAHSMTLARERMILELREEFLEMRQPSGAFPSVAVPLPK
jgi:hypothetical protein